MFGVFIRVSLAAGRDPATTAASLEHAEMASFIARYLFCSGFADYSGATTLLARGFAVSARQPLPCRRSVMGVDGSIRIVRSLVVLFDLLLAVQAIRASAPPTHIQCFGRVSATYYRGAQPKGEDFRDLAALGIKAVIDLKQGDATAESEIVRRLGMKFYSIPMSHKSGPSEAAVVEFLKIVNDPANQPVFVHCKGGHDRTGVMTAIYRMTHDGWTASEAYREMTQYGYDSSVAGPALKDLLFNYARKVSAPLK
jgi:protein tyrosine phosphatase (PTP) superfamily phosphohydrolase (DUF442 family)